MLRRIRRCLCRLGFNECFSMSDVCFRMFVLSEFTNIQKRTSNHETISCFNSSKHLLHRQLPSYSHSVMLAIYSVSALVKTAFIQSHCKILLTLQTNISPHLGQESGACFSIGFACLRKSSFKRTTSVLLLKFYRQSRHKIKLSRIISIYIGV